MRSTGLFVFFCLLTSPIIGQTTDSTLRNNSSQYALARYPPLDRHSARLYTGYEYVGHDPRLKGTPYFDVNDWKPGDIRFDGRDFTAVPMLYDLVRDVVVVEHVAGYRMSLRSDKISSFSFLNHRFIRLTDTIDRDMRPGFYDLLYDGPTQLLAKRIKTTKINPSAGQGLGTFDSKVIYYIRKNGQYQSVKNRKTLLAALVDKKKELTEYIREQKIKFRSDPEPAFVTLMRYYDQSGK